MLDLIDCPICGGAVVGCGTCGGIGEVEPDRIVRCGMCKGTGEVDGDCSCGGGHGMNYNCALCGNAGIIVEKCETCEGTGEVEAQYYKEGDSCE